MTTEQTIAPKFTLHLISNYTGLYLECTRADKKDGNTELKKIGSHASTMAECLQIMARKAETLGW